MSSKNCFILSFKFKNVFFSVQQPVKAGIPQRNLLYFDFVKMWTEHSKLIFFGYPFHFFSFQVIGQLSCQHKQVVRKAVQIG